jgi:hypothetical protein
VPFSALRAENGTPKKKDTALPKARIAYLIRRVIYGHFAFLGLWAQENEAQKERE